MRRYARKIQTPRSGRAQALDTSMVQSRAKIAHLEVELKRLLDAEGVTLAEAEPLPELMRRDCDFGLPSEGTLDANQVRNQCMRTQLPWRQGGARSAVSARSCKRPFQ